MLAPSLTLPSPSPSAPPLGGWWGGLAAPNTILLLEMGHEKSVHKSDSALRAISVPYVIACPYNIVPYPSLDEYRPPLTMIEGCDMDKRPCSLSFPCWSVDPHGRRGLSGCQMTPEGGHSWSTQRGRHWHRIALRGPGLTCPGPPFWIPPGPPPKSLPSVG